MEKVELAIKLKPDMIIMDIAMPDMNGIEATRFSLLTSRERQVLQLIAEGKTTKEIAYTLKVNTNKTIETYRQQTMDKLDIHTIAGLTKYAVREGLTSIEEI